MKKMPCRQQVKLYFENTTLHGLKYITEDGRHPVERFLWVVCCAAGVFLAAFFINPIFQKWQNSPTITTVETTSYPIWNINFPAVTICSVNKAVKSQFNALLKIEPWKTVGNTLPKKKALQNALDLLVNLGSPYVIEKYKTNVLVKEIIDSYKNDTTMLMRKLVLPCSKMTFICWWHGKKENCTDMFEIRRTDDGFCCSFNSKRPIELLKQDGTDYNSSEDAFYFDYGSILDYIYSDYNLNNEETPNYILSDTVHIEDIGMSVPEGRKSANVGNSVPGDSGNVDSSVPAKRKSGNGGNSVPVDILSNNVNNDAATNTEGQLPGDENKRYSAAYLRKGGVRTVNVEKEVTYQLKTIRRTNAASYYMGFSVALNSMIHDYLVPSADFIGFKVLVHDPKDFPNVASKGIAVSHGQETYISVTPTDTYTTEAARMTVSPDRRGCVFDDEHKLKFYNFYSRVNCLLECRIHEMVRRCGCKHYYYPTLDKTQSEACDMNGLMCLQNMTEIMHTLLSGQELEGLDEVDGLSCSCPASCEETHYSQEISFGQFPNVQSKVFNMLKEANFQGRVREVALLHVFFKDLTMVRFRRDSLYTWTDMVAAFGGVAGLCLGFSLISAVELIYFFTLRIMLQHKEHNGAID